MSRMRRASIGLLMSSVLVLAGCSSSDQANPSSTQPDCGETFCIGLVLDGGILDDGAFHSAAWAGVQVAAEATGGYAEYLGSSNPEEYTQNINEFAERGFDVIVTTNVGLPEITAQAAVERSDSYFIGVSQDMAGVAANAIGLVFRDDQAGYAAGYLAGLMTRTGTVGAVLGSERVIPLKRFGEGYRLGVLAARPDVTVLMNYNEAEDSFNDPEWGSATALEQVRQGSDIVFGAGGTTGTSALITVAEQPGAGTTLWCIGIDTDQYQSVPLARPCLLTSAEKKIAIGVESIIADIHAGIPPSGNVEGEVGLAPFYDFDPSVPAEVKERMNQVLAGLSDGTISTGVDVR